jgi:hypothetical protein
VLGAECSTVRSGLPCRARSRADGSVPRQYPESVGPFSRTPSTTEEDSAVRCDRCHFVGVAILTVEGGNDVALFEFEAPECGGSPSGVQHVDPCIDLSAGGGGGQALSSLVRQRLEICELRVRWGARIVLSQHILHVFCDEHSGDKPWNGRWQRNMELYGDSLLISRRASRPSIEPFDDFLPVAESHGLPCLWTSDGVIEAAMQEG